VEADFSVELGRDDPVLEIPWVAENGPRYLGLKRNPELLLELEEARRFSELRDFLVFLNSPSSVLETAKCDAWASDQIHPEEEIFGAAWKFGSYVDLLFSQEQARFSFDDHERFARRVVDLLKHVPEIPASAEFIIRRCYYHEHADPRDGFYITVYVLGFGDDEEQARQQWGIGLKLVENAMRQPRLFHRVP
jgi:hypothetical protein